MSTPADGGPVGYSPKVWFGGEQIAGSPGMTLRDYFAAHAPQYQWLGMDASDTNQFKAMHMAEWHYAFADAMLKEREK